MIALFSNHPEKQKQTAPDIPLGMVATAHIRTGSACWIIFAETLNKVAEAPRGTMNISDG